MDPPARRRQHLARSLKGLGLDALLVSQPVNVTYLTGFTGEASRLILGRRDALLVSDGRFDQQIAEECPGLAVHIRPPDRSPNQATADAMSQTGHRAVGFEAQHLTVADLEALRGLAPTVNWSPQCDRVEALRQIKDAGEIALIRASIRIAERAFAMLRALIRPGDTEKELADALESYVRRAGGRCTAFPSIVAVGERSAMPHAPPTSRRVEEADFLLVDWGAAGPLYHSDLTRVLRRAGTGTDRPKGRRRGAARVETDLETVYTVVRSAQERAIAACRPGVPVREVDAVARQAIAAAGFGDRFTHGLGHGLGLQIHEAPFLRANSAEVLQAGMVVTIEPGVYLPGWGGVRIEDDILVTPDGCEVLTSVPRDPAELLVPSC